MFKEREEGAFVEHRKEDLLTAALQTPPPKRNIEVPVWREFVALKTTPEARVTHFPIFRFLDQNILSCSYLTIDIM